MTNLVKSAVLDACRHRLTGHGAATIQQSMLALANHVDPHLKMDAYGQGAVINHFEDKIAACLGKEAAVFMPSGTMAQQIALRIWADRSGRDTVGMHPTCHLYVHENDAYAELHHLSAVMVGDAERQMTLADVQKLTTPPGSLLIELPQRHNGGTLPPWDELLAIRAWANEHDVILHLDGARLWESCNFYQRSETEIAALFDSVYVSFYKGLGGTGGAMLLGSTGLIEQARVWQRRHGGNLFQLFQLVIAADLGFETYRPRMDVYVSRAKELAAFINTLPHVTVTPRVPQANMMHLTFDKPQAEVEAAALEVADETGLWLFNSLWSRPFAKDMPVVELTVGEATMRAGLELATRALKLLSDRL